MGTSVHREVREIDQCRTTAVTIEIWDWPHVGESPARPRRQASEARAAAVQGRKSKESSFIAVAASGWTARRRDRPFRVEGKLRLLWEDDTPTSRGAIFGDCTGSNTER